VYFWKERPMIVQSDPLSRASAMLGIATTGLILIGNIYGVLTVKSV
jgi:hypothetical protein